MKTRASPCSYRKEKSFCSSVTRSTLSSERKRSFSLLPVSRFLASTLAKAPPLPGLTWLALVTTHRPPLCCRTMPGLMVLALIFMRTVGLVAGGRQAPTARAWRAKSPRALEDKAKKGNGDGVAACCFRLGCPDRVQPDWPGARECRSEPPAWLRRGRACALHGRRRPPARRRTWRPESGSSAQSGGRPARPR